MVAYLIAALRQTCFVGSNPVAKVWLGRVRNWSGRQDWLAALGPADLPEGSPSSLRYVKPASQVRTLSPRFGWVRLDIGRGDRIRTCDPLLPKQMRYQTALHPEQRGKRKTNDGRDVKPYFEGFPSTLPTAACHPPKSFAQVQPKTPNTLKSPAIMSIELHFW